MPATLYGLDRYGLEISDLKPLETGRSRSPPPFAEFLSNRCSLSPLWRSARGSHSAYGAKFEDLHLGGSEGYTAIAVMRYPDSAAPLADFLLSLSFRG